MLGSIHNVENMNPRSQEFVLLARGNWVELLRVPYLKYVLGGKSASNGHCHHSDSLTGNLEYPRSIMGSE